MLNLQTNPDAAFLLVDNSEFYNLVPPSQDDDPPPNDHLHVNTVHANYEGFTKQQVKNVERACRLMGMVATPSECDFQGLVRQNLLKDCPVTNENDQNAHAIFDPDLASIRGETVCCKPEQIVTDYVKIPRDFFSSHNRVTLIADKMFVNLVPFLVSACLNINLLPSNTHLTKKHPSWATFSSVSSVFMPVLILLSGQS